MKKKAFDPNDRTLAAMIAAWKIKKKENCPSSRSLAHEVYEYVKKTYGEVNENHRSMFRVHNNGLTVEEMRIFNYDLESAMVVRQMN